MFQEPAKGMSEFQILELFITGFELQTDSLIVYVQAEPHPLPKYDQNSKFQECKRPH